MIAKRRTTLFFSINTKWDCRCKRCDLASYTAVSTVRPLQDMIADTKPDAGKEGFVNCVHCKAIHYNM